MVTQKGTKIVTYENTIKIVMIKPAAVAVAKAWKTFSRILNSLTLCAAS